MIYLSATCKNSQGLTKTKRHLSFFKRRFILPKRSISSAGRAFGEEKDEVFSGKEGVFYPVGIGFDGWGLFFSVNLTSIGDIFLLIYLFHILIFLLWK